MMAEAPQVAGFMCLPWANIAHHGRDVGQSRTEKEWSGTFKAAYDWSDEVMTYASVARGYKAGGFNLDRVQSSNGLSSGVGGITPVDEDEVVHRNAMQDERNLLFVAATRPRERLGKPRQCAQTVCTMPLRLRR